NSLDEKSLYRNAKKARFYQPGFFFCLGRYSVLEGVIFAQFHEAVEIRQRLAAFRPEETTSVARFHDAVGAECAEGVAQFAPADNRPDLAPEPKAERANITLAFTRFQIAIADIEYIALIDRAVHRVADAALALADYLLWCANLRACVACAHFL